jgi:hypothetical protein
MRRINQTRQAGRSLDLDRRHEVEPKKSKIGKVVLGQPFTKQMRVNAAKPAKPVCRNARPAKIRHLDLFRCSDDDVFDLTFAVQENANLSVCIVGDLRHLPSELRRDDLI